MFGAWFWWSLLGVLLIGAETFIPGLAIIFFGLGALATALVSLVPGLSGAYGLQALIWTVASIGSLVLLRKKFKELLAGTAFYRSPDEGPVDALAGEEAEVIERIADGTPGRVHFRGTSWKAVAYDESFEPGAKVRVAGRDGLALVVTHDYLAPPDGVESLPDPRAAGSGKDRDR